MASSKSSGASIALEISSISKSLSIGDDTLQILNGITMTIAAGESCAIVGASGSGKTTLLGILAGMDPPDSGEVVLIDSDRRYSLYEHDEDWRASLRGAEMGFVFQNFQLIADMSALDNVLLPLQLSGSGDQRLAEIWLHSVGLGNRLHHYPRQLSGGEQQRVALARAFANSPRLLFADEPTGSLDESTAASMIELLFELNRTAGSTMILVTHDPALATRCDKIYRLSNGVIVEQGDSSAKAASR